MAKLGCGVLCWGSVSARLPSTVEDTSAEMCSSSSHSTWWDPEEEEDVNGGPRW